MWNWDHLIKPKTHAFKGENVLCLTSGTGDGYVREAVEELGIKADILKLDMPYPLPKEKIEELFTNYDKVIVFEESYPCIEEQLSSPKLYGKLTKHLHQIDEFSKDKVVTAFANAGVIAQSHAYKSEKYTEELPKRPPICAQAVHTVMFTMPLQKCLKRKSLSILLTSAVTHLASIKRRLTPSYVWVQVFLWQVVLAFQTQTKPL